MGTLFDQPARDLKGIQLERDLPEFIEQLKKVAVKANVSLDQTLKAYELMELVRKNDLFVIDRDVHDEQMAGLGEILKEMAIKIGELKIVSNEE